MAVAATGPGRFSVDRALGWDDNLSGLWWGIGTLGAALVIACVTHERRSVSAKRLRAACGIAERKGDPGESLPPRPYRGAQIRTGDLSDPNGARYQAAPHPEAAQRVAAFGTNQSQSSPLCCLHRQRGGQRHEQRHPDRKPDDGRRAARVRAGEASRDVRARSRSRRRKGSETDFFRISVWDRQAQVCADYLAKGRKVALEGRLNTGRGKTRERSEVPSKSSRIAWSSSPTPQLRVRRWCRSRRPSPRNSSIASLHASGRSPISKCPQPGITRRRARRRRVYSNASSSGSCASSAPRARARGNGPPPALPGDLGAKRLPGAVDVGVQQLRRQKPFDGLIGQADRIRDRDEPEHEPAQKWRTRNAAAVPRGETAGPDRAEHREQVPPPDVPDAEPRRRGEHDRGNIIRPSQGHPQHDHPPRASARRPPQAASPHARRRESPGRQRARGPSHRGQGGPTRRVRGDPAPAAGGISGREAARARSSSPLPLPSPCGSRMSGGPSPPDEITRARSLESR